MSDCNALFQYPDGDVSDCNALFHYPDGGEVSVCNALVQYPDGGEVTDCDALFQYPDGESSSPYVFICENPQELIIKLPIKGKHKICKLCLLLLNH